jgi:hypothetical protein
MPICMYIYYIVSTDIKKEKETRSESKGMRVMCVCLRRGTGVGQIAQSCSEFFVH